jgi:hypothetical protein
MTHAVVTIEELEAQLREMGYRFLELYVGNVKSYRYCRETSSIDSTRHLPMERIRHGLSEFGPMAVNGSYMVVADVEKGAVVRLDYRFSYTIRAERGAARAQVVLHGRMDAPFPRGWPTEHSLEARLFVGPVAMGKGQKARAKRLGREILALVPAFVDAFPEAMIVAVLETRGGLGGWKRAEALHVLGRAQELARAGTLQPILEDTDCGRSA